MSANDLLLLIALIVLAGFVGFSVISKVPNSLHTPLMSGTNAIPVSYTHLRAHET